MDVRGWGENATTVALPVVPLRGADQKWNSSAHRMDALERAAHHKASKSHGAHGAGAGELECVINSVQCHDRFRAAAAAAHSFTRWRGKNPDMPCVLEIEHQHWHFSSLLLVAGLIASPIIQSHLWNGQNSEPQFACHDL